MNEALSQLDPVIWRPQARLQANIESRKQLNDFNDSGGIAVNLDVSRHCNPDITISGSQSSGLSLWETQSKNGFVTKPKFSSNLITLRFVTNGQISYLTSSGEIQASKQLAVITRFDELRQVNASSAVSALSATIAVSSLLDANAAMMGEGHHHLPTLAPIAEMTQPGMAALFCTVRQVQRRLQELVEHTDLVLPLLQELINYQLISFWPKQDKDTAVRAPEISSRQINSAIDYIDQNLASELTLSDVAMAAGIGVRSLQLKFKKELGLTPIQYIIEMRLKRAHHDLISTAATRRSVSEIARLWGFIHMSDFGQRYRRLYGCTPSQTRKDADQSQSSRTRGSVG